jgi:hypothetical protein
MYRVANFISSDGELGDQNRCESESSEPNILVVLHPLSESYLISGDGKTISDVEISARTSTEFTRHALLKDKLHIFGGISGGGQVVNLIYLKNYSLLGKFPIQIDYKLNLKGFI